MKINNTRGYINIYNEEKVLFKEIGPKAKERGFLTFKEFYKICIWKSNRPKQRYIKNKDRVEQVSKKAFSEKDEIKKIEVLCELEGVAVPTASAILTVVFPEKYAVIDVRAIEMLNHFGFKIKKSMTSKDWLNYLTLMRNIAKENAITPRELDMVLFAMHKEKLENEDFKNLYEK